MTEMNKTTIINSLLKYLPGISNSLTKLVDKLERMSHSENPRDEEAVENILHELSNLLLSTKLLTSEVKSLPKSSNKEDIKLYQHYIDSLDKSIKAVQLMIEWLSSESEDEDKLYTAIDLLFEAGQMIIQIVNRITHR